MDEQTSFARWAQGVVDAHYREAGVERPTLEQMATRTGIAFTTIRSLLRGTPPSAYTVVRFATAYGQDVPAALRLAGHAEMAAAWEESRGERRNGAEPALPLSAPPVESRPECIPPPVYGFFTDEQLDDADRAEAAAIIAALHASRRARLQRQRGDNQEG